MGKLLIDVDREALERVRVQLGARSEVAALRKLIEMHDQVGASLSDLDRLVPASIGADTSRAKVTGPGMTKAAYGSRLKKR